MNLNVCLSLTLAALLAGCGGGSGGGGTAGGGGDGGPVPLPLMFDSLGRQVAEADFGAGDAAAAGADGTAFDAGPMASAQVTLTDAAGNTRTASTDASGYYRMSIKGLTPPFVVKVKRGDGTEWFSASTAPVKARGFLTINISGATDKVLSYVADGAASTVTPATLAANPAALVSAKAKLNTGLAAPLTNAGIDPTGYDPVSTPLAAANGTDKHAIFLSGLLTYQTSPGRTALMATVAGDASAALVSAEGVAVDAAGNLLVADRDANVVRRISPAGMVTTFGTGERGFANGPSATATFDFPGDVAADAAGNIFVADSGNNAIRKIDANGIVSTLVTGPLMKPTSLAADGAGGVYYAIPYVGAFRVAADGTVTPVANLANAANASGIARDPAGNLYVALNGALKIVDRVNKIVTITPGGTMSEMLLPFIPGEIAVDAAGTIYALDALYPRVWKVAPGIPGVLAGATTPGFADGTWTDARFTTFLRAIAVDPAGNVLVADVGNNAIRKITPAGVTTTVAGRLGGFRDGAGALAKFADPFGVAIDRDGAILVGDSGNNAIRKISPTGAVSTLAAGFNRPTGVAVDAAGNVYVADTGNHAIRRISATGDVSTVAGTGEAGSADGNASLATFTSPGNLAVNLQGDIYLSDLDSTRMRRISAGTVSTVGSITGFGAYLGGIVADSSGTIFFKSSFAWTHPDCLCGFTAAVFSVAPDGTFAQRTPTAAGSVTALAIDGQDNLYHQRYLGTANLVRVSPASVETGLFRYPRFEGARIAVDRNGNIVVVDFSNAIKIVLP